MIPETKENKLNILNQLAYESYKKGEYEKAIIYFERYLEIDNTNETIYNFIGYVYKKMSKFDNLDKQIDYFKKALELSPNLTQAYRNLALTYPYVENYEEAIKCYHKLFELDTVTDDRVAYGCFMMRLKEFDEGLKFYEYRFKKTIGATEYPEINDIPRWEGQSLSEKTLLVQYEQGFGDTLQFCRYINLLTPLAYKVIFRVQNNLLDLMKSNFPQVQVVGMDTSLSELKFDYHIPLISVLRILKQQAYDIPFSEGYLKADEALIKQYKESYFNNNKLKIGISWHGAAGGNPVRDIHLKYFYPLAQLANVQLYSFQKNAGSENLKGVPATISIIDLGKTFNDFSDTAAAMANLDLFVTSDNGVFNLAGAMGVKTDLLINHFPEWRWFLEDKINPWYKNVTMFKKEFENESWDSIMQKVTTEILKT